MFFIINHPDISLKDKKKKNYFGSQAAWIQNELRERREKASYFHNLRWKVEKSVTRAYKRRYKAQNQVLLFLSVIFEISENSWITHFYFI